MTLATFKMATGLTPFGHDDAGTYLAQAYSLLSVLNAAWDDASKMERNQDTIGRGSEFFEITSPIMGSALDGIATLVALGAFIAENPEGQ